MRIHNGCSFSNDTFTNDEYIFYDCRFDNETLILKNTEALFIRCRFDTLKRIEIVDPSAGYDDPFVECRFGYPVDLMIRSAAYEVDIPDNLHLSSLQLCDGDYNVNNRFYVGPHLHVDADLKCGGEQENALTYFKEIYPETEPKYPSMIPRSKDTKMNVLDNLSGHCIGSVLFHNDTDYIDEVCNFKATIIPGLDGDGDGSTEPIGFTMSNGADGRIDETGIRDGEIYADELTIYSPQQSYSLVGMYIECDTVTAYADIYSMRHTTIDCEKMVIVGDVKGTGFTDAKIACDKLSIKGSAHPGIFDRCVGELKHLCMDSVRWGVLDNAELDIDMITAHDIDDGAELCADTVVIDNAEDIGCIEYAKTVVITGRFDKPIRDLPKSVSVVDFERVDSKGPFVVLDKYVETPHKIYRHLRKEIVLSGFLTDAMVEARKELDRYFGRDTTEDIELVQDSPCKILGIMDDDLVVADLYVVGQVSPWWFALLAGFATFTVITRLGSEYT